MNADDKERSMARKAMPWKPRASSMGYYALCDYRALLDRMASLGEIESIDDSGPKGYADLGTCIHFTMQDGMRCNFPGSPSDHAYTPEQLASASTLFGGDEQKTLEQIRKCALRSSKKMPKLDEGVEWHCELELKGADVEGHLDFLSDDGEWVVDLKTTTRPPPGKRCKREHLVQVFTYRNLVEEIYGEVPKRGLILYADSMKAQWDLPVPFDFHTDEAMEYAEQIKAYTKHLRSVRLEGACLPRISSKCGDYFCKYRSICHDALTPPAGTYDNDDVVDGLPRSTGHVTLESIANG